MKLETCYSHYLAGTCLSIAKGKGKGFSQYTYRVVLVCVSAELRVPEAYNSRSVSSAEDEEDSEA